MDDFKAFLQIVHISDLHVIDPKSPHAVALRSRIRTWRRLSSALVARLADGMAPHDELAASLFTDFLSEITAQDAVWSSCKTWLVDTGDLTSLGDSASLDLGGRHLKAFAKVCPDVASTYGNHDAWPGRFPLFAADAAISAQTTALTARKYVVAAPTGSLSNPIPHGAGHVHLYFVDSIIHERKRNTLALGEVPASQLDALKNIVDQTSSAQSHDFRILAVHHPVHYPPPRPRTQMVMRNDSAVAVELDTPTPGGIHPVAHLIMSGHTHRLFPAHGTLPSQTALCNHHDLGDEQCQLVVGSLMQLDKLNQRLGWPHQCQVLRLYYSRSHPSVIYVERLLAARQSGQQYRGAGIGPYKFVPVGPQTGVAEGITFAL
jgi:3',5'-cyclic AMP phosphodiesterase CpdA